MSALPVGVREFIAEKPEHTTKELILTYFVFMSVKRRVTSKSLFKILSPYCNSDLTFETFCKYLSQVMQIPTMRHIVEVSTDIGVNNTTFLYTRIKQSGSVPCIADIKTTAKDIAAHGTYKQEENKARKECELQNPILQAGLKAANTPTFDRIATYYSSQVHILKDELKDEKDTVSGMSKVILVVALCMQ